MPAVPSPATIFVTGVSGFSGAWIARALLGNGYAVRCTVRSEKAAYIADLFKVHGDRFESVIVPDIAKAVLNDSISAVVHVAGVANLSATDVSDIMGPNTDCVLSLLESTLRHGPHGLVLKNVKHFVYMSSAQAMLGHEDLFHVYTEVVGGQALYRASKVLAERAVINVVEEHKKEIGWDATRIVPAWWKAFKDFNLSSKILYQHLTTPCDDDRVNDDVSDYVDVRDVADAFVAALKVEAAGNERFILDAGAYTFQDLYDAVHATAPGLQGVVLGNPSAPPFSFPGVFCDSCKAKRVLQLKQFRTLGECAVDTLKSIRGRL
ncbi:hypothetical protein BD309DRAFT_972795 [Dichomitus squalens]|nr:hypothetical protein BD309DRAFT_972795 [Dichomitus squalens]